MIITYIISGIILVVLLICVYGALKPVEVTDEYLYGCSAEEYTNKMMNQKSQYNEKKR